MRGENASNWEYGTSHMCVCAFEYTSHSIKQMAREGHTRTNPAKQGGVGQSESNGEEIWFNLVVWMTK